MSRTISEKLSVQNIGSASGLLEAVKAHGCLVFGTGFVANMFDEALVLHGAAQCVRGYLASSPEPGERRANVEVRAASDESVNREALVCVAVHEANAKAVMDALDREGYANVVWVYPFLYDLLYGEPLFRNVLIPIDMLLAAQDPSYCWLAVRALAARGIAGEGTVAEADARDLYLKAQSLHCGEATAERRYDNLKNLVKSMQRDGFDASRPVLLDTRLNIIDGLHRVAVAYVLGKAAVPCSLVKPSDAFSKLLTDRNKMTAPLLREAGLTDEQLNLVQRELRVQLGVRDGAALQDGAPTPEISFIVPAYNVAEYLDQCMESIVAQTYANFEVLLIDDGSTDGTGERCEEWARRDDRIQCVRKANGGVSECRNLGIELARGAYLAFVDPDDWLDVRYLEVLHEAALQNDALLAECDIWRYDNRSGSKIHRSCGQRTGVPHTLEEHMVYGPTASYKAISKRSLWMENNVRFPPCSFESPAIYALVVALAGERRAYVPEPLYYYRRFRPNSLVETAYASVRGKADNTLGVEAMAYLCGQFRERGLYERYETLMPRLAAYRLSDILAMQYHRRSAEDFEQLAANQRAFMKEMFPQVPQGPYLTWGGYNLNKVLQNLPMINDPSCRFNFSSIVALAYEGEGASLVAHHSNRYREMMVQRELDQEFWKVVRHERPQFVFMDLVDDRFDVVECAGRYLTCSDAFEGATIEGAPLGRRLAFGSADHEALWREAAARFVKRLFKEASQVRLVVVENYLSERIGTIGSVRDHDGIDAIRRTNETLARLYGLMRTAAPEAVFVPAYTCDDYFTDEAYEYGAVPQHLNDIVNQKIAQLIEEAVFE